MTSVNDFVFTVTKIYGVDCVKTRVYRNEEDADRDIAENIRTISEDGEEIQEVLKSEGESYYIILPSKNPEEYIEIIKRRCEIK